MGNIVCFMMTILIRKKGGGRLFPLPFHASGLERGWDAVPPFDSFASPPWHWRQNCAVWLLPAVPLAGL
jgi:hypothetical protein